MNNRLIKLIFISNILLFCSPYSMAKQTGDKNSNLYARDKPIVNTDCRDATDYIQDLKFHIQKLDDVMNNLCNIRAMKNCSSQIESEIIKKYDTDINNLSADVNLMMNDALKQACNIDVKN